VPEGRRFVITGLSRLSVRVVHQLVAFRHDFGEALPDTATLASWRAGGVHLGAVDGTTAIVCGPSTSPVIKELLHA
jgi:hypothetical protein